MIKQISTFTIALSVFFLVTTATSFAGDINSWENPLEFPELGTVPGYFNEDTPINYFLFSASGDGQYVISHSTTTPSVYIRLYAVNPEEGGGENIIPYDTETGASYYALRAGQYRIVVTESSGIIKNYTMTNSYAPPTFPADIEPNDTALQAFPLLMDGEVYGHHGYAYDAYGGMPVYNSFDYLDVWKITTEEDGYFIVDSELAETLEFNLYLYDENDQLMLGYYESDTLTNVEHQLAAGTYYIRTDYDAGFGSYMLKTSLEETFLENDPEPNDEILTAKVLPVGSEDTGHIGFTDHANDSVNGYYKVYDADDYWKITTTEDGILSVASTSTVDFDEGPFVHLYMYSAEGRLMHSNYNSDDSLTMISSINVAAGTYYVDVDWKSGYGSYLIACELEPSALAADTEPNDTKEDAVEVTLEEPVTGHLGFIIDTLSGINGYYNKFDTDDYWKITYDQDTVLELTLTAEIDFEDTLSMYMYVYNEENSLIKSDYGSDQIVINIDPLAREAGYIYVHTKHVDGYGSYTLSAVLSPAALAGDANPDNPNDSIADATQLPINNIGTGHLGFTKHYEDNIDYWTFYASKEDTLYVTAISENEFGEGPVLYLKLLKESTTLITDYNNDYSDTSQVAYYVTPGTYYAAVSSRSGYGSYMLSVLYPSEEIRILTETLDPAVKGEEYSMAVEVNYSGEETLSYELLVNPLWLTISEEGVLGGTPGLDDSVLDIPITIRVFSTYSEDILETFINIEDALAIFQDGFPTAFHLSEPYPNPFNPTTAIEYSIPQDSHLTLTIYNINGQLVNLLKNEIQSAGNYSVTWDAVDMPSGLYFCTLKAGGFAETRKMVLVK